MLAAQGMMFETRKMSPTEYKQALKAKLAEEVCESAAAIEDMTSPSYRDNVCNELADLVYVAIVAAAEFAGEDWNGLQTRVAKRRRERGAFDRKIKLLYTEEEEGL